jgi:anti-anti-sigma factor
MEHRHITSGDLIELILKGRFTFTDNKTFSGLLEGISNQEYKKVVIDLEGVDFIDSAALGILLLARDRCEKASVSLTLRNPVGQVKQMFKISKFNELFKIEERAAS